MSRSSTGGSSASRYSSCAWLRKVSLSILTKYSYRGSPPPSGWAARLDIQDHMANTFLTGGYALSSTGRHTTWCERYASSLTYPAHAPTKNLTDQPAGSVLAHVLATTLPRSLRRMSRLETMPIRTGVLATARSAVFEILVLRTLCSPPSSSCCFCQRWSCALSLASSTTHLQKGQSSTLNAHWFLLM